MDPALITLAFATLAFAGGHFLLSSAPVRGPLSGMMGERPFRAILEGRRTLVMRDVGWWRVALGSVLYLVILFVHETVFGMHLFPA